MMWNILKAGFVFVCGMAVFVSVVALLTFVQQILSEPLAEPGKFLFDYLSVAWLVYFVFGTLHFDVWPFLREVSRIARGGRR